MHLPVMVPVDGRHDHPENTEGDEGEVGLGCALGTRARSNSEFFSPFSFLFLSIISTPLVVSWTTKRILLCMKLGQ